MFTANRCHANPVLWSRRWSRTASSGRGPELGRRQLLHRPGRLPDHPRGGRAGRRAARDRRDRRRGLLDRPDRPDRRTGRAARGVERRRRAIGRRARGRRAGDHDHRHRRKQAVVAGAGWSIGGMAKGAGMLAPQLATMLVVLTTDAVVPAADLDRRCGPRPASASIVSTPTAACRPTTRSPSGERRERDHPVVPDFTEALTQLCTDLAMQLLRDAEGADHDIAITMLNAASEDDAVEVGRASPGATCSRPRCSARTRTGVGCWPHRHHAATFDPADLDVAMNGVWVCKASEPDADPREVDLSRARGHRDHRPQGRNRARDRVDQRPHPRLRPREQRVRLMTDNQTHPAEAVRAASSPTALPG